jgi:hypothetical protein
MFAFALFLFAGCGRVFMEKGRRSLMSTRVVQDICLSAYVTVHSLLPIEDIEREKFYQGNQRFLETKKNSYLDHGSLFRD